MRHAFGVIPGGIREASTVNGSPDPATLASIEPSIGGTIRERRWDRTAGRGVDRGGASTTPVIRVRKPPPRSLKRQLQHDRVVRWLTVAHTFPNQPLDSHVHGGADLESIPEAKITTLIVQGYPDPRRPCPRAAR